MGLKQIVILLTVITLATLILGQKCDLRNLMSQYLHCLKGQLDQNYGHFEQEIQSDTKRAVEACFAQNNNEANQKEKCVLASSDLESKAWDRNGPLRDCSICRTFAATAIKAILSTPAEDQKCIRVQITKAIAAEAEYCLRQKIQNFPGLSEIPDLEEGSYKFRDDVISSISNHIIINSRLSFCAERKQNRALASRQCLKKPFNGYYQRQCNALSQCDQLVENSCQSDLQNTKESTCECIDNARDDLKTRIAGIADVIRSAVDGSTRGAPSIGGSGTKVDACINNIKRQLITPSNDWAQVIDSALNNCIKNKPSGQSLGIDSLLNVGCRKIIADTTDTATKQIKAGFDFINNLIDAMVERSRRFCNGSNC